MEFRKERRIYTKFGDSGETMLLGKKKVPKDSLRVSVYGVVDEVTSTLGLARASTHSNDLVNIILVLQGELINLMAELATPAGVEPPVAPVSDAQVENLEKWIDAYEEERIAINAFVRPGCSMASAALDLARATLRRAERQLVALHRVEPVSPSMMRYFNRLSDLFYVLARIDEQREIRKVVTKALAIDSISLQRIGETEMNLKLSNRMIEAGISKAQEINIPMVLAVVDAGGNLVELRRMDNALLVSAQLAPNKAHTAAVVRMPTHLLAQLAQPGQPLYSIDTNISSLTLIGGGFPIIQSGEVVGAVGVSGGSVEQDIVVAEAMLVGLD